MNNETKYSAVCFGEVLWDVMPGNKQPGGAPMNVAYHLQNLGVPTAMITKTGADQNGEELIDVMRTKGLVTDFFKVDTQHPTGLVEADVSNANEVLYNIVFPSAWDFINVGSKEMILAAGADYFVYGSLSGRHAVSKQSLLDLLDAATFRVCDINLRAPHYSRQYVELLLNKAHILKINEEELQLLTGWYKPFSSTRDRMAQIADRFKVKTLIVTLGANGAVVSHDGQLYQQPGYKVTVTDTIGSGDAFLAGFLYQHRLQSTMNEALAFAAAMGAYVATQPGACPAYQLADIQQLQSQGIYQQVGAK